MGVVFANQEVLAEYLEYLLAKRVFVVLINFSPIGASPPIQSKGEKLLHAFP